MRPFGKERDLSKPLEQLELQVRASDLQMRAEAVAIRLDRFLAQHLAWRSRSSIQTLIKDGYVWIDVTSPDKPRGSGEFVQERRPSRVLRDKCHVIVVVPEGERIVVTPVVGDDLVVLFEDELLLAVDKPPMLPVHPSGRHLSDTLIQRVHARQQTALPARNFKPRLCHRLDRETSGIVLLGLDARGHAEIRRQFEEHEIDKEYLAIVQGHPESDSGVIEFPIGSARSSRIGLKMSCRPDGDEAKTAWRVLERQRGSALVLCRLFTGRQHQIRVHMEAIGHPLIGDKLYGYDEQIFQRQADSTLTPADMHALELPRHALHHHRLGFTHPRTKERIVIESPLAPDLAAFVESRRATESP